MTEYLTGEKSTIGQVFDALSDAGSMDGCDPDWCTDVLSRASQEDIDAVKSAFRRGEIKAEAPSESQSSELRSNLATSRWGWMGEI
jgi:hypothetical protein